MSNEAHGKIVITGKGIIVRKSVNDLCIVKSWLYAYYSHMVHVFDVVDLISLKVKMLVHVL